MGVGSSDYYCPRIVWSTSWTPRKYLCSHPSPCQAVNLQPGAGTLGMCTSPAAVIRAVLNNPGRGQKGSDRCSARQVTIHTSISWGWTTHATCWPPCWPSSAAGPGPSRPFSHHHYTARGNTEHSRPFLDQQGNHTGGAGGPRMCGGRSVQHYLVIVRAGVTGSPRVLDSPQ